MEQWKGNWKTVRNVFLDPLTVLFIIVAAGFAIVTQLDSGAAGRIFSAIMGIIAAAFASARATRLWDDIMGQSVLKARGQSAVRGLRLLLGSVMELGNRTARFMEDQGQDNPTDLTRRNLEEIWGRCTLLAEETAAAIENWTDIVPEADVKTHVGEITRLQGQLADQQRALRNLETQLEETEAVNADQRKELEAEIREKEKQISSLRTEVLLSQYQFKAEMSPLTASGTLQNLPNAVTSKYAQSWKSPPPSPEWRTRTETTSEAVDPRKQDD